jgi:co-chaperonin GroES (HSP10)
MRLLGNSVLIAPIPQAQQSEGGIYFDMTRQDDQKQWLVLQTGWGSFRVKKGKPPVYLPIEVWPGDRVLVDMSLGAKALEDGSHRRIVDASQILAKW